MKKNKLTLSELQVKSFVTDQSGFNANTLKGGTHSTLWEYTDLEICQSDAICPVFTAVFCETDQACKKKVPTQP